jgi:glycerophosphoryl diester phosphodiesterase
VTSDGVPVVHHDPVAGPYPIWRTPLELLRRYRLPNGAPVPTLAEALTVVGPAMTVYVEVKELAEPDDMALLDVLDGAADSAQCEVHSFDHRIVRRLRARRRDLAVGILSTSYPVDPVRQALDAGAIRLWQHAAYVDDALIVACRRVDVSVYAWTVDDPDRMRTLKSLGVGAICTNRPDVAREVMG